ncbi:MAG: preprotein translocase subunit SecG [Syntrophomonadaceae bacterium]|jgi:preprotein translocase subunit SecG|nr:preprotein translocase subunit SecG [Bacillota bacterium]NLM87698.1 preprotein translocase subunit SecG [Syntrophomonadaceae bacterium]HQA50083.1 preprotein translocase subunit SecG [Syntrophomonadaceae bacterium]HQD90434.1 preprotein translocase subunit SecG [Syntrophomonadaceae bacterium]
MLKTVVLIVQIICAIGLIATVLLQSGKSAGLSGSIAGGGEAIFGKKKGLDDLFSKMTAYISVVFLVATLLLSLL